MMVPVVVSCGDGAGPSAADESAPTVGPTVGDAVAPALAAFVEFPRYLQLKRTVEVAVTNSGEDPARILSVDLDSTAFTDTPAVSFDSTVGPGRRRDLQVPLGDAACDAVESEDPTAIAHLVVDGVGRVALEIDPAPLQEIADDECGRARVFEAADIAFGDEWAVEDDVLIVPITVRALGDSPVTLEQVAGSVIFVVEAVAPVDGSTDRVELTAEPGAPEAETSVRIRAERCEPHAVAESKKTFVFPIWVRVADDEVRYVTIEPDPPLRAALQVLIDECQRALASVPR